MTRHYTAEIDLEFTQMFGDPSIEFLKQQGPSMAFEIEEGTGTMHINEGATGNQPTHRMTLKLNGELIQFAGWRRVSQNGKHWMFIKRDERESTPKDETAPSGEVPF